VSHTTREPREGEEDGVHYHFTSREAMEAEIAEGKFLEHTEAHGNLYGTSLAAVEAVVESGKVCVLDIDAEGAKMVATTAKEAQFVLIKMPSLSALEERMRERGDADDDQIAERLSTAEAEQSACEESGLFTTTIVNDNLEDAFMELCFAVSRRHPEAVPPSPLPLVLGGPFGVGQGVLIERLLTEFPTVFGFPVPHTTRAAREGEVEGEDFAFVTAEEFEAMEAAGTFLETARVENDAHEFDSHGTSARAAMRVGFEGKICILEADAAAMKQLRQKGLRAVYIYVTPSSAEAHSARLREIGEAEGDIPKRLAQAAEEVDAANADSSLYDAMIKFETNIEVTYARLKEAISKRSPKEVPLHSVWGYGRPLWDNSLRVYGDKPLRVCLIGPAASGKSTQAELLTAEFGLPLISTGHLLREVVYKNPSELGLKAKEYLDNTKVVPDEFLLELIKWRVAEPDCMAAGWLLDGFPHTPAQATALKGMGIVPDKVIFLEAEHAGLYERTKGRRIDPMTDITYHLENRRPEDEEITARLSIRHDDTEENVQNRLTLYDQQLIPLKALFSPMSDYVQCARSVEEVFADVCKHIKTEDVKGPEVKITSAKELKKIEYACVGALKLRTKLLVLLRDRLTPTFTEDLWVDIDELSKVAEDLQMVHDYASFTTTVAQDKLDMLSTPVPTLFHVESKEPIKVLVSMLVAPPEPVKPPKPLPLVVCGPSGVGKGTLINKLMETYPDKFGFSVSHTTREPREGEEDGVHYHFTSREAMEAEIAEGKFLEYADVHGNFYGTSLAAVEAVLDTGKVCVLDIDVQGAKKVRQSTLKAKFIFVAPPSLRALEERLRGRGTEKEEAIAKRLANAAGEVRMSKEMGLFDAVIVNDDVDKAYELFADFAAVDRGAEKQLPTDTCTLLLEENDWRSAEAGRSALQLSTTNAAGSLLSLPRGKHELKLNVDRGFFSSVTFRSATPFVLEDAATVLKEKNGLETSVVEGVYEEQTGRHWCAWFRHSFTVAATTHVQAAIAIGDVAMLPFMRFFAIDNDTGVSTPCIGRQPAKAFEPNTHGYTYAAFSDSTLAMSPGRWRLSLSADAALGDLKPVPTDKREEFDGQYAPNKELIVTQYTLCPTERSQLAFHFLLDRPAAFTLVVYSPDGEVVKAYDALTSLTEQALNLEGIAKDAKYRIEVKLVRGKCPFDIHPNGNIPGVIGWRLLAYASKPVDFAPDEARERYYQETVTSWNEKDPKARPDQAQAALTAREEHNTRAPEEQEPETRQYKEQDLELTPSSSLKRVPMPESGIYASLVLKPESYDERAAQVQQAVSLATQAHEELVAAREAAVGARGDFKDQKKAEFTEWRSGAILSTRDSFNAKRQAYLDSLKPPPEPEQAETS